MDMSIPQTSFHFIVISLSQHPLKDPKNCSLEKSVTVMCINPMYLNFRSAPCSFSEHFQPVWEDFQDAVAARIF